MSKLATYLRVCVFTNTSYIRLFQMSGTDITGLNIDQLTANETKAFKATEAARTRLWSKYESASVDVLLCPYDYDQNVVTVNRAGFGQNLPAIIMYAYYEDNTMRQYTIPNIVGGLKVWDEQELYAHMMALYEQKFGENDSILCKLLPPLCSLGAYVWLGITAVATYKALEAKSVPVKALWGTGAYLSFDSFRKGAEGKKMIKKWTGIGGTDCSCNS